MSTVGVSANRASVEGWVSVCDSDRLRADRGACALVNGVQVALFRTSFGELFAVGNQDPFSGANVMSRGIVGSVMGRCVVTSPMYKQRFDLETGECVDDPTRSLAVHAIVDVDGTILVNLTRVASEAASP
jgi:nitrite reductase (NADH) small subunit